MNYAQTKKLLLKIMNDKILMDKCYQTSENLCLQGIGKKTNTRRNRRLQAFCEIQELLEEYKCLQTKIDVIAFDKDVAKEVYLLTKDKNEL